jgi:hypothetical protein
VVEPVVLGVVVAGVVGPVVLGVVPGGIVEPVVLGAVLVRVVEPVVLLVVLTGVVEGTIKHKYLYKSETLNRLTDQVAVTLVTRICSKSIVLY